MRLAPIIRDREEARQGRWTAAVSILKPGLLAFAVVALATRFYFVKELLVAWAALAVLFLVGSNLLLFLVLAHECGRWSLRKFKEAGQAKVLSLQPPAVVGARKLALPSAMEINPEVSLPVGLCIPQAKKQSW